jgi:hypothetical protein
MPNPSRPPAERFEPGDKLLKVLWGIAGISVVMMIAYGLTLTWW